MKSEPVMFWVLGAGTVVQAGMQVLIAFGVHITAPEQAAVTTFVSALTAWIARSQVTPIP